MGEIYLLLGSQSILLFCQTPLQLANPTELQLDGVGVDFVFPCHKKDEEGRNNPHLAFTSRKGTTGLYFVAGLSVSGECLENVWKISVVSGGCLKGF